MASTLLRLLHWERWKFPPLRIDGLIVNRCPGVFKPGRLTRTSLLLARSMLVKEGFEVLDLGCGTGILGLLAAKRGARRVVAIDPNPKAVECTRLNSRVNRLEDRVEVRLGSLFQPLKPGEKFDLILFNPPYLPGRPRNLVEAGWLDSGSLLSKFFQEAPGRLKPEGLIQLAYSSLGVWPSSSILKEALKTGLQPLEEKHFKGFLEVFTVYTFRKAF